MCFTRRLTIALSLAFFLLEAPSHATSNDADLFDLSLDELVSLRIDGYAVRDLQLYAPIYTGYLGQQEHFDIAATVDVIDAKTIAARGLNNIVEVAENMVGVLSGESPSEPYSLGMRGFTRDTVRVLYDGISIGYATGNMRPLSTHNLQQVEVIKGPSVLQHGQGASAGTINFISKRAEAKGSTTSTTTFSRGMYGSSSIGVEMNVPLTKGAYRFDLYHRESDGWVNQADSTTTDMHLGYLFTPSTDMQLYFKYSHLEDDLPAYWGTPLVPLSEAIDPSDAVNRQDGFVLDESLLGNNFNVIDHVINSKSDWYRLDIDWKLSSRVKSKSSLYYFSADRHWRNSESYIFDSNTQLVDRDRLLVSHDRRVFGFQSHLTTEEELFGFSNSAMLSLEYSVNEFSRLVGFNQTNFFVDTVNLMDTVSGYFGDVSTRKDFIDETNTALVLNDRIHFNNQTHLELGIRQEHIEMDRRRFNFDGSERESLIKSFDLTSYRLALNYEIQRGNRVFIQYGEQHDDITGDLVTPLVEDVSEFEPSDTQQWELGLKSSFYNTALQLTCSIYSIEKKAKLLRNGTESDAVTKSDGVEVSVSNRFTDQFKLGLNASYVDSRYGNYYDLDYDRDVSGNRPVNVPETMASVWGSFSQLFSLPIEVGLGTNFVSKRFADSSNDTTLNEYTLYHMFAAYNVDNFRMMLQVRNVTDEVYVPWSDIYYTEQALAAPPRTYEA
jgi:iron complex outermembrane receptor protein